MAMVVAGPAFTVTVAVCVMATPPTVAETVLAPRPVELSVPVATPPASVVPAGWVSVFPVPEAVRTKLAPPIGRPLASRAVTVMVLTLVPALAVMALGAAVTVVPVELAGRGVAVAVNVVVALRPATVAARAFEPGVGPRVQLSTVAIPFVSVVAGLPPLT